MTPGDDLYLYLSFNGDRTAGTIQVSDLQLLSGYPLPTVARFESPPLDFAVFRPFLRRFKSM